MFKSLFSRKQTRLPHGRREALHKIKQRLGWRIRNEEIFLQALRHRSASATHLASNERLELLGDAVLSLLVCEYLYQTRPNDDEGKLTEIRSLIVSKKVLCKVARELGFGELLELSSDETASGGRLKDNILADSFEAMLGAYYLDAGLAAVREFMNRGFFWRIPHLIADDSYKNHKGLLQEVMQSHRDDRAVRYSLKDESGPEHSRSYTIEIKISRKRYGVATAPTKKNAEQLAAQQAIEKLKAEYHGKS
ncbi:MAG: ribonuclease III [Candidatus Edwardsbacteria bacterium]|nr:ribonuclease III [Candidatus Edwardsbacteria bacterium]